MNDPLREALHDAMENDADQVGWGPSRTTDLPMEEVHRVIDAVWEARARLTPEAVADYLAANPEVAERIQRPIHVGVPTLNVAYTECPACGQRTAIVGYVPTTLDVDRLAWAICAEDESIESDPVDFDDCPDRADHLDYARAIARAYGAP